MAPKLYRRCASCYRLAPRDTLWRIVRLSFPSGDTQVVLDAGMGRSVYLCPCEACLRQAQKKNRLGRSLKAPIPPAIFAVLAARLTPTHEPIPKTDETTETTAPVSDG